MQGNPKVNIAVVQMDCVVGEITPNLNKIRHFAALAASLGADIAIYPECCTTGYFIGDKLCTLAEPDDGATAKELGDIARSSKLHLAVGMFTKDGNAVRNSQLLFAPDGNVSRPITRRICSRASANSAGPATSRWSPTPSSARSA